MWTLPTYMPLFACGIAAAVLAHGRRPTRPTAAALLVAGTAIVLLNGYWHEEGTGFAGHVITDLPAGVGFAVIVAVVASRPAGVLSLAPFRALGAVSYGVYLWHMPVMFALMLQGAFPVTAQAALPAGARPDLRAGHRELVAGGAPRPALGGGGDADPGAAPRTPPRRPNRRPRRLIPAPVFTIASTLGARSSAGERSLHTREVAGSKPAGRAAGAVHDPQR